MTGTEAIYAVLASTAAVTSQIGAGASMRLHYDLLPEGRSLPAIVLQPDPEMHDLVHGGVSGRVSGSVRVNCFASSPLAAADLASTVIDTLNGFKGIVTSAGASLWLKRVVIDSNEEIPVMPPEGAAQSLTHGRRLDAAYHYRPAPTS